MHNFRNHPQYLILGLECSPYKTAVSLDNYTVYGLYVVRDNNMTVFYDEVGLISRKQLGYEVRVLAYTFVSRGWDQIPTSRWFYSTRI